ncbi:MAG: DUF2541 family protein [Hyphomicrobiaceae bacterium]|nr:DUF2541 family protein [Hyphomicrobiaceae bacterium]
MLKQSLLVIGAASAVMATAGTASAQRGDRAGWEQLGCVTVSRRADRDVIKIGRREGRFKAIRLSASGNDVDILDLKVVYANGAPDDIQVRSELRQGAETRPLDLKGRDRAIDRIEVVTKRDFKGRGKGRAKLCAQGLKNDRKADGAPGRPGGPGGKWVELGCQKVGFLTDRDVLKVGRREGRFKAIRLEVSGNAVYINDLKVIYANGAPDDIPVRAEIREGGQSGPLDLKGRERAIDRIEMIYRSKPNFKGSARVCVSARD